ncbi:hypothetical protein BJ166DRAFT_108787 [Pestalotiopsis sp. NC0098]|nr:hypothetical protein BJ166DRAFT_108787 [Pestalotiopsis sp. NC0098]
MGVTALGTAIPPSRQKNCHTCVQSKRRCDRRMPICSRCAEKNVVCDYSMTRTAIQADRRVRQDRSTTFATDATDLESAVASNPLFGHDLGSEADYMRPIDADFVPDFYAESPLRIPGDTGSNDVLMGDHVDNFIGSDMPASTDQWLVALDGDSVVERPDTPADEEITQSYQKMASVCNNITPWHLHDPSTPLYHIMTRIKAFVTDMATRNATPFMHRLLYRDYTPECIVSCFSTSVLYANRTPMNTAMVMRALHGGASDLVTTESARFVTTTTERLARAQALLMYQVIRLFDGDITLRAQAEKDIPLLNAWLVELCKMRNNLSTVARLEHGVEKPQPPEWERWIFAESVRRTIVMAYSVLSLYELLKNPDCEEDPDPWSYMHRWTLSRHLWEAKSPAEFRRAWAEKPHFVMENHSFQRFLEQGRGADVDEFAAILLSVYIGVDATEEFMASHETEV